MKIFVVFLAAMFASSCSMPNLEPVECTESRDAVKSFYSQHFASDMKFTADALKEKSKFLTPEFAALLGKFVTESDPFTLSQDKPRAFRVGGCKVNRAGEKTEVTALVFWKDQTKTEQLPIRFDMAKQDDKWLINNIYGDKQNLRELLNH